MPRPLIPNRREAILDFAERLVPDHGFSSMSVQQIAANSGISKGALYREFESKNEVLEALLAHGNARLIDQVREQSLKSSRPLTLSATNRFGVEILLDDQLMTAALLDNTAVLGAHAQRANDGRYQDRVECLTDYVASLQADGTLRSDASPAAISLALSSFTISLLSAASLLGPVSHNELSAALDVTISLIEGAFEGPVSKSSIPQGLPTTPSSQDAHQILLNKVASQVAKRSVKEMGPTPT